ncbi:tyrosine--tRNA ligase [Candidatus Beckwithbacteria bacterium CG22_combo_CG10-13_8_21_14_all_01_47_9]|uniref:Tyrosine--tRNA ligase n=2 Tax=Candidatus Beckwithiibacteriota TaxID=1752726 RepID=A0A2H0E2A3_9BACT|nr:MAG: tyrosine--tRNA ligase [Candidatus Beckwithbacteria bacterium CG22_combo_CG10-13_8_21_14_all_01_47_9]PJC66355.1 MAG: tyrosine--tRNA ligase [Candidatus Beckwithbacteria bacterium CG_4_9_14_0_2_um_filter_47_11]
MSNMQLTTDYVLTRGVAEILPTKEGLKKLMESRKISLYEGFDPTSPSLHIGHLIGIRKLAQFQKLGHQVIFLIGDFTGMIGDPTDKTSARQKLTHEQMLNNLKGYKEQVKNIIDFDGDNPVKIVFNYDWLSKLTFADVVELATHFTVQQMIERDFYQERLKQNKPIYLHEFMYPLMQGYDSAHMAVDLEIGGNDQMFNLLAGRTLEKAYKNKDKFCLTTKLLTDPTGAKMGKTTGNTVNLTDSPNDIFGKIMALPDSLLPLGFELLTDMDQPETEPMTAKKILALEVVKQIHGEKSAHAAQKNFEQTFQKKAPEYKQKIKAQANLMLTVAQIAGSNSEAKRLIAQGAVDVNGVKASDGTVTMRAGDKVKIGQKTFIKVI